jgi:hypothetical protein
LDLHYLILNYLCQPLVLLILELLVADKRRKTEKSEAEGTDRVVGCLQKKKNREVRGGSDGAQQTLELHE